MLNPIKFLNQIIVSTSMGNYKLNLNFMRTHVRLSIMVLLFVLIRTNTSYAQNVYFPPIVGTTWDTLSPAALQWCQTPIDSLYAFLDTNKTKAFILLKDGKIVLEKYFGTHTATTPWYWASAGKTLTAFMVGLAQQQNYLSITDTTSNYLGNGWTSCTLPQERAIKIRNQLTMTSGLDDGVPDHYCTLDTCLNYLAPAGSRWAYHNGPYTLLDTVMTIATGMPYNTFVNQALKTPTGMTGSFVNSGFNRVFVSTARSMARFGLLILNKGNWNGNQVMTDTNYFNAMLNTSQPHNLSYGYLWWLNGKSSYMLPQVPFVINGPMFPNAPSDVVAAMGKNGQFLNVSKSQNLVWLRMGDSPDSNEVPALLNNKIWQYIQQLPCNGTSVGQVVAESACGVYPNPGTLALHVEATKTIRSVGVYSLYGQCMVQALPENNKWQTETLQWPTGFYCVKVHFTDGTSQSIRWIKQ